MIARALRPIFFTVAALALATPISAGAEPSHGLAMHGDLKYPPDFTHFDYVNPDAPKGDTVTLSALFSFDSFNPFISKGRPAAGLSDLYDTLMVNSADEAFSEYGLLAETVETPEDRSWVEFTLRDDAFWHDGAPVTAEDVIWTFETLVEKGAPFYRFYYGSVETATKTGPRSVRFDFKPGDNRELPLIMGQLSVLPKHYWQDRDFDATTLEPPLGSGPYRIKSFDPKRRIVFERVEDYWGRNHPTQRGLHNFAEKRYEYFRDQTVAIEAFKAGEYDFRSENSSKSWATAYNIPEVETGAVVKEELPHGRSAGMQGFVMNMRRPLFEDKRVRQALVHAFDFEWSNQTLFYGQYARTESFFQNSDLAAEGPPTGRELEILEPFRDRLPPEVFEGTYTPPSTDGTGNTRPNLVKALHLLHEAGWAFDRDRKVMVHKETGRAFRFEILLVSPQFERIVLPYVQNLQKVGLDVRVRVVDSSQYQERLNTFDFDMIVFSFGQSLSPGNEQRNYWSSEAAERPGSRNFAGVQDPVVDELVELVISAPTREELIYRTRALDRVLQWKFIIVPNWHTPVDRVVYWNNFAHPEVTPQNGLVFDAWWIDTDKLAKLDGRIERAETPVPTQ